MSAISSVAAPRVVAVRPARVQRVAPARAYGQDSKYFDLNDLENTVGAWDMYGQEDAKRYPGLQNEFFERAGSSISSRGSLLRLVTVVGAASILIWGGKGSQLANLPITKGPVGPTENGKGGKAGRL